MKTEQETKVSTQPQVAAIQSEATATVQTTAAQNDKSVVKTASNNQNVIDLSNYKSESVVTLKRGDFTMQLKVKDNSLIPDFAKLFGDLVVANSRAVYVFTEGVFHNDLNAEQKLRALFAGIRDKVFAEGKQ